jgi:hypothetical protein
MPWGWPCHVYTKAEVIARWGPTAWHAGTAAMVAINCYAPPAIAHGGPLPPLPAHVGSISGGGISQPTASAPDYGPSPLQFLPTPEEFSLPIPNGAFSFPVAGFVVTPGLVRQETTPVQTQPCYQGQPLAPSYTCDQPPVDTPEPSGALVLGVALLGLAGWRRCRG